MEADNTRIIITMVGESLHAGGVEEEDIGTSSVLRYQLSEPRRVPRRHQIRYHAGREVQMQAMVHLLWLDLVICFLGIPF